MFYRLLCSLALSLTANIALAQEHGNIWRDLDDCAVECSQRCVDLTDRLQDRLQATTDSCSGQIPVDQTLYKEIYDFAYSSSGLDLSSQAAKEFADLMVSKPHARDNFEAYKGAYTFAYSSSGLDLSQQSARDFAVLMTKQRSPKQAFNCYKQAYEFAYSSSGLDLSQQGARDHAVKTCRIQEGQ